MGLFDFLKVQEFKSIISTLENEKSKLTLEKEQLEGLLTPEMRDIQNIQLRINRLKAEQESVESILTSKQQEEKKLCQKLSDLEFQLKRKEKEIIAADDLIELENFALYKPKYKFVHSDEYKEKLDINRNKQKSMIRNGTAATGSQTWTVNNSAAQGRKLVNDMIKLCLRSFNNECEAAVSTVKFNNFDRCQARITKSAESISKLGKIMSVSISRQYVLLKIEELSIALEYQMKKQQEKEEMKEMRAQQREEARLAKEIEEARKLNEKEKKHYLNALAKIEQQLSECSSEDEKELLEEKKSEIVLHLKDIEEQIKSIDYREANQRAGYVYIISNIGAFGENIFKIGMTRRLDPQERVDELGDASVPFNFDIHAMIFSDDAPKLENTLHREFENKKINMINTRREFFNVTLDEIKRVVKENHDKTVEFIEAPDAYQYRESLKLKEVI
ncbi:DUF4041 domain-containing protein [Aminipila butyrica]|uniref:DUF4041 domain-containing protein n=1 Tax=Aminipila butyrica TaxID=433296 RepID=A0A858BRL8_9FIRM|nr:DUF4041 domain-containing protein [Aminipila butyrica]QIB68581.1 DUF4041 domain-containing protein [Aminipila butyrica]